MSTNSLALHLCKVLAEFTNFTLHLGRGKTHEDETHRQERQENRTPPACIRGSRHKECNEADEGAKGRRYPMTDCLFHMSLHCFFDVKNPFAATG